MDSRSKRVFREQLMSARTCVVLALGVVLGAASASAGLMESAQARPDFPQMRQTVTYQAMDEETGDRRRRTTTLSDRDEVARFPSRTAPTPDASTIVPAVASYTVEPGLANVANRADFKRFTQQQTDLLVQNGFVVTPSNHEQMFNVYEQNVYWNLPNFVTTDVLLHTFGDLFAYSLRKVERRVLFGWTSVLARVLREESWRQHRSSGDRAVKAAALRNVVFFGVAEKLLARERVTLPASVATDVNAELARIREAAGEATCFTGTKIDYTEFKPRGHYALSEDGKNYFRAMQWFAQVPFDLPRDRSFSPDVLEAQLIVLALDSAKHRGVAGRAAWERIDDLVTLFTAATNNLSPREWRTCIATVYGDHPTAGEFADADRQARFLDELRKLPTPAVARVTTQNLSPWHMRFLPKRAVLDAQIMQRLVDSASRPHSTALDVMSVLGSARARSLLEAAPLPSWYAGRATELTDWIGSFSTDDWTRGVYSGMLWLLRAVPPPADLAGLPFFMRSSAWADKSLTTQCGSWAELRHHTILYAESYSAEGGGDQYRVNLPKGYVEPNAVFFRRLRWLTAKLQFELGTRGCLTENMKTKFELFGEIATRCGTIADAELTNRRLQRDDYEYIHFIGSKLAQITTNCLLNDEGLWSNLPEAQRNQALVADVGSSGGTCLEVATGRAQEIFVVVPGPRGPRLTRGAVFAYYEFLQPTSNRLTDAQWQQKLAGRRPPSPTRWQESYRAEQPKPSPTGLQDRAEEFIDFDYIYESD